MCWPPGPCNAPTSPRSMQAKTCQSRDLWTHVEKGAAQGKLTVSVAAGAGTLYSLHSCSQ